ncbi:M1 family metallopeptidase [Duganella sp. HH101]|uniref:M1 family metallopeptidase n=1 Tax=Duganella sp. HH101 TaxID=1781066 RepID=UPI0008941584|nr:M1 family metallopeptidase [Duganella sp. HH101]OFA04344.1 aminopeptidase N [Duganella sp. HH101]
MRARSVLCLALALAFPVTSALAQSAPPPRFEFAKAPGRLPKNVVPLEYTIALTPNAAERTVAGTASIALSFKTASATIQFNSLNQKLSKVLLDGKPVKTVVSDDKAQLTTVTLARPAAAGPHTLSFNYVGKIEKEPRGLFLQEYVTPAGAKDALLTTQFEATDARRMFPCWDEPAFRAVFKLSVTVPAKWAVYSNMPEAARSVHGELATTRFAPTPKMPSYLVEFTGGNLAHISAESGGTIFRVAAVQGQEQGGQQALANARQILADYNDYFGVRYPLPKLDSIAIPGGFGGAMENWGAITYNDQALLITPSSTMGNRQNVYSIQAHEMAHQWFGDLVTMGWWDELWLNESFASWMAARQTDLRNPSWRWWEHQDESKEGAMNADSRATSHAIVQHVTNELEATNAFDPAITYSKGQAVLRMLEAYMGPDTFRNGIRAYMKAHAYSNTFGGDLWKALDAAGAGNVSDIATAWTSQPGYPLVSVSASCDIFGSRTINLMQQRFLLQGMGSGKGRWPVPLQVRSGTGAARPVLFDGDQQSMAAGRCDEPLSVNAGALGYYRVAYDGFTLTQNTASFGTLPEADRIALLDDQWALVGAGEQPLGSYLALASAMGATPNQRAWEQITGALDTIETAERGTPGHAAFAAYARALIKPLSTQLGWEARPDEAPGMQKLRRALLADLGKWGDQEVIAGARQRFAAFVADRKAIAADDQAMVLQTVAANATAADFAQLRAVAKSARNETEMRRFYTALMRVSDPALAKQAAAIALSDEIPQQADMVRMTLVGVLADEHPQLAWSVFAEHTERLLAPHQPFGPMILAQYSPEMFWRALPPEALEAWIKGRVPADLLPNLGRGMEAARFKLAEKAMLVQSADAYLGSKAARTD